MRNIMILSCLFVVLAMLIFSYTGNAAEIKGPAKKPAKPAAAKPAAKPAIGVQECKSSTEPFFATKADNKVISNASFTINPALVFYPSQKSADLLEWDFGDGQKLVQRTKVSGEFLEVSHTYDSLGTYPVTLSAARDCKENGSRKDVFTQEVTVFDPGLLTCSSTIKIADDELKTYRIDALIYWIKSLRKDITRINSISLLWNTMAEKLDKVKNNGKGLESNKILAKNILENTSQSISRLTGMAEPGSMPDLAPSPELVSHITASIADSKTVNALSAIIEELEGVKDIEVANGTAIVKKCSEALGTTEFVLRRRGNYLIKKIKEGESELKETAGNPTNDVDKMIADKNKIDEQHARVKKIKRTTPLSYDYRFQTFDDFDQYFFKFTMGYEFTTVNKLFQKGNPVVGFIVYMRLGERFEAGSGHSLDWPFGYGMHSKFTALINSSAEQETVISGLTTTVDSSAPKNSGEDKAIGFDEEIFLPVYRTARLNNGKIWAYIGPVALIGAKIVEKRDAENTTSSSGINSRLYWGFKFAMNPELYTDILYGRTSSLQSRRLELRAQLPVYRFNESSRLFLGGVANIGVKDKVANEADNYRIYLTWNVNFASIYEFFSGEQISATQTE